MLGNYKIGMSLLYSQGKTLGEGTFGKVKLGVHIPSEEKVAVKIL
jgi:5'-AMP-activated protein kinase catalytic alpha subunit